MIGWRRVSILGTGALLILALFILSSDSFSQVLRGHPCTPEELSVLVEFIYPSSAENIWSRCLSAVGFTFATYFEMRSDELHNFIDATQIEDLSTEQRPVQDFCPVSEFECPFEAITSATDFLYGTQSGNDWFEEVFINTSQAGKYEVYYVKGAG